MITEPPVSTRSPVTTASPRLLNCVLGICTMSRACTIVLVEHDLPSEPTKKKELERN